MNGLHDFRLGSIKVKGTPLVEMERGMVCVHCLQRMNEAAPVCPGKPSHAQPVERAILSPAEKMVTRCERVNRTFV